MRYHIERYPAISTSARQKRATCFALAATCLIAFNEVSAAPVNYEEGVSGDLNGQTLSAFDTGPNTVTGHTDANFHGDDLFTITILPGQQLDSIDVLQFSGPLTVSAQGFNLFESGNLANKYGFLNLNNTYLGTDILPVVLADPSGNGSTAPLGPGSYRVALLSGGPIEYQYQFNVSAQSSNAVPDSSSTLALLLLGTVGLGSLKGCRKLIL